jgi:hypothetical protein
MPAPLREKVTCAPLLPAPASVSQILTNVHEQKPWDDALGSAFGYGFAIGATVGAVGVAHAKLISQR